MTNSITLDLPKMYPKQERAVFASERYSYIEGSTKSGKTVAMIIWQLVQTQQKKGVHWWIAPTYSVAKIAFRRVIEMLADTGNLLIKSTSQTSLEIIFTNGSIWQFKSGIDPDKLYGEECESIVIDEASRVSEEVFTAANSTMTTTLGPMRIIGNVSGRGNWFYKHCRNAENGQPNTLYTKLVAMDAVEAGILPIEALQDAKNMLTEAIYKELYECIPMASASNPFGTDNIISCATIPEGQLANGPAVCFGLDVAHVHDWMVLIGLNVNGEVCSFDRWQLEFREATKRIRQIVPANIPLCIDKTGVGFTYVDELKHTHSVVPFTFNQNSKRQLMDNLSFGLNNNLIAIPINSILYRELLEMEMNYKLVNGINQMNYNAPNGAHDDTVDALALCYYVGTSHNRLKGNVKRIKELNEGNPTVKLNVKPMGGTAWMRY